jgi:hypothetical protein
LGVMTCMHVLDVEEDDFQLRTRSLDLRNRTHMYGCGIVNDEQAVAEAI